VAVMGRARAGKAALGRAVLRRREGLRGERPALAHS